MHNDTLSITALQRLCMHDGPGVRTTVFLHGCYLDCPWCCNPETKQSSRGYFIDRGKCPPPGEALCGSCSDDMPNKACLLGACEAAVTDRDIADLKTELLRDRDYWGAGGGVTFSGGEPLMQTEKMLTLLKALRSEGVNIFFETSAFAPKEKYDAVKELVDGFIVDVKVLDKPVTATSGQLDFDYVLGDIASSGKLERLRMVLIDSVTDTGENAGALVRLINRHAIKRVELLPYHSLGSNKYVKLGLTPPDFSDAKPRRKQEIMDLLRERCAGIAGLEITLQRI